MKLIRVLGMGIPFNGIIAIPIDIVIESSNVDSAILEAKSYSQSSHFMTAYDANSGELLKVEN
jgi:hypothetical protein